MEQLNGADAIFLAMESPTTPTHVGGMTILDISEAPDFSFETLLEVLAERIPIEPRYTMKLRDTSYGIDRPYLVHDPEFDVRNHVKRIAVASPGGLKELAELVGFLHASPLDRDKPLWEMWLIEGAENGRVAMYSKTHHCLMDGQAGSDLGELLCDLEANPEHPPSALGRGPRVITEFSDFELSLRAARQVVGTPGRLLDFASEVIGQSVASLRASRKDKEAPPQFSAVPRMPFNAKVGQRRAFACSSVSLTDIKAIKKHFDVTVNDVVLAVSGTAMRNYLTKRGELPDESLVALIAISTRKEGDATASNQVTTVPVSWATNIDDPVDRLMQVHRNADKAKEFASNYSSDWLAGMGAALPPALTSLLFRSAGDLAGFFVPSNVVVSSVRGTPIPLYMAGAKIECMYPISVVMDGAGLNLTVVSYMDRFDFGFVADPGLVPDLWELAEGIPAATADLLEATHKTPAPEPRSRRK
jgi:WS/DGAT/MGAT family acyltransferase